MNNDEKLSYQSTFNITETLLGMALGENKLKEIADIVSGGVTLTYFNSVDKTKKMQLNDSTEITYLQSGGFSHVYGVKNKEDRYVLKVSNANDEEMKDLVKKEFDFISSIKNPYIVNMIGYKLDIPLLIMEWVSHELSELIDHPESVTAKRVYQLTHDIASGLDFLHQQKILHRDVKAENVVYDDEYHAKLIDFGFAVKMNDAGKYETNVLEGTVSYLAPELLKAPNDSIKIYTAKSDVYAFGVTINELLSGKHLSGYENGSELYDTCGKIKPFQSMKTSYKIKHIIFNCLKEDESSRPFLSDVIKEVNKALQSYDKSHDDIENIIKEDQLNALNDVSIKNQLQSEEKKYLSTMITYSNREQLKQFTLPSLINSLRDHFTIDNLAKILITLSQKEVFEVLGTFGHLGKEDIKQLMLTVDPACYSSIVNYYKNYFKERNYHFGLIASLYPNYRINFLDAVLSFVDESDLDAMMKTLPLFDYMQFIDWHFTTRDFSRLLSHIPHGYLRVFYESKVYDLDIIPNKEYFKALLLLLSEHEKYPHDHLEFKKFIEENLEMAYEKFKLWKQNKLENIFLELLSLNKEKPQEKMMLSDESTQSESYSEPLEPLYEEYSSSLINHSLFSNRSSSFKYISSSNEEEYTRYDDYRSPSYD